MAVGTLGDFKIYEDQFYSGLWESIDQMISAFNEQSRGALLLRSDRHRGQYQQASFLKDISGLISRRDVTSVATVTDTAMTQDELVKVKLARRVGPIAQTRDAWRKIDEDPEVMSFILGQMVAPKKLQEMLNTGLAAVAAALKAQSALVEDDTAGTLNTTGLIDGLARFGDMAGDLVAWISHSKPYYNLVKEQISANVFQIGGFAVQTGTPVTMNRPIVVTDSASLIVTGTPNTYDVLGLAVGGVDVTESEGESVVFEPVTGMANLVDRLQGEYAYSLGLKGFKWDIANGGANPAAAALATGSNWDKAVSFDKQLAGVVIRVQ